MTIFFCLHSFTHSLLTHSLAHSFILEFCANCQCGNETLSSNVSLEGQTR